MADNTTVWTFEQLAGNRRKLTLSDHAAPHGAPRRGAVVEDEIEMQMATVRYGGNAPVTRHLFGTKFQPMRISGRFSDSRGGAGFARKKTAEVKSFVDENQPVLITWDNIIACTGHIARFKPSRESGGEVAWEIEYEVDGDDLLQRTPDLPVIAKSPVTFTSKIAALLNEAPSLRELPTLRGSVFDAMDSFVSALNQVTAEVAQTAGEINAFTNAPFALLRRFRAGLEQLRTAAVRLRFAFDDLNTNLALERENADQSLKFWDVQSIWSTSLLAILEEALNADEAAAEAEKGRMLTLYTAREGDTWERISLEMFQSAARADDIRTANGVDAGADPMAGAIYRIPR
jgi:hypothetical protein